MEFSRRKKKIVDLHRSYDPILSCVEESANMWGGHILFLVAGIGCKNEQFFQTPELLIFLNKNGIDKVITI